MIKKYLFFQRSPFIQDINYLLISAVIARFKYREDIVFLG